MSTVVAADDTSKAMVINGIDTYGKITGTGQTSIGSTIYNYENPGNDGALDGTKTIQGGYPLYTSHRLNGLMIGRNSSIRDGTSSIYSGMVIGDYARATGGLSIAMGNYAQATNASSVAIGTATLSSGFNSLAMMRQSAAKGNFSTAIGTAAWANATGSFAMGYSATAKGEQSIAIGAAETITIPGGGTIPSAKYNAAGNTVTEGNRSLAFGTKARTGVGAHDSMAFGSNSITAGVNAIAMGNSAQATEADAFAFGNTSTAKGSNSIAMGKTAEATKANAIALGGLSKAKDEAAIAIGGKAEASKNGTLAIGTGAKADNIRAVAIGIESEVTGEDSMAIGAKAVAEAKNSLALGAGTEIRGALVNTYSAFTNEMNPAASGVVAVANVGTERRIINVAGGQNDTDAVNVKQLRYVNNNLAQTIAGSTYTGYEANGSTYKAPDFDIKNTTYHTVKEAVEAAQTNFFSAKGVSTDANYDNKGATGTNATAAGVRASAAGNYGTALGADATATNEKSTALGYKAKVTADNSVALGSGSVASTAAGVAGYNVKTADNRANAYSGLTGAVATSTLGAVSVGETSSTGTQTRQITNVAAGTNDSDAVNVAQLRNVNLKIAGNTGTNDVLLDNQTLSVKGDGTYITSSVTGQTIVVDLTTDTKNKIDNAADKDLSNITNVAKKNITALGTIVAAGNNVTIGAPTVDATTGQKTYTVNAMDTKVTLGTSGLMTLTGGTPDTTGVRTYTVDVDPTKVAKTDLTNITNGGKTIIQQEAQKAVKVVAGQNTTVTEGTDGTYKTYAVNVEATSDYRLVENSAAADKAYKVTGNKVDLNVKDEKSGTTKTVTIKDIASKTELDKLDDRAVKYDLDPATNTVDKSKVTYEGPAYTNKTGGTHVTNVAYATGNDGSEAVNVDYLTDKIKDSSDALINKGLKFDANVGGIQTNKLGSTVTVKGEGTAADAKYSGENIKTFIEQDKSGNTIINVKMNKDIIADTIKVNKDGRDGKDGVSITGPSGVVGTDGNNGKVGITGADGKDAVSISGKDGVGHIGLTGPAGTNGINGTNGIDMTVKNGYDDATKGVKGEKGVDGKDGITRIVYADKTGEHQVATMDDGMLYGGDSGTVIKKKLNNQINVKGGITDPAKFTADDNIGVVSDGTDTLKVRLAKDLKGLDTVTVAKTVTAGTATVGKQEVTKADGTKETGNYVTGLDNKTWDADNIVTGRAATEDQLKTVSDAVKQASASATDYRLVENDTVTDKAYTVTSNKVDLTVRDEKSGTTKTVTIKDIASKTELDKLDDRAVKYDLDPATNKADKSKVTYEGPTYNSTNKSGGTHVTNVAYATGTDGSEAVNVDYLTDKIKDSSDALINKGLKFDANVGGVKTNKLGSTVKVQGEGTEADANYSGKNIKTFIGQDTAGNTTIDVKMNKNLEVETITATGAAGKDGKIGINGKDGVTTNISITRDGQPGVDGAAGTTTTRIVYEKPDGTKEEVATLNDGLKFKGDMGATSNVKLNKQVDVNGGVTNAADLATGNNIGVTSAAVDAQGNAKLQLQLAKDITGLKSVTASDTVKAGIATVGKQTVNDNKATAQTGNFVTGLDNKAWNMADPAFVSGRAATEDQLKTVSDAVKQASASATDYRLVENDAATDKAYTVTSNKVDLNVKDEKSGTTKTVTIKDIASKTELDKLDDRAVKYDLDPATNTVDKSKVTYEGPAYTNKTGGTHVTNVAYATGNDGSEAVNVDYLTDKIKDSSDALINKGLKFDANVGGIQTNKLGSTVTVKGEGTAADAKYSGENIKTFIDQDKSGNTTINVKMNKDIVADSIKVNKDGRDGKDGVSITSPTGAAGTDGNNGKVGITGADGKDAVSISGKDGVGHIGLTGPAGTNGKDGSNGIDMTVKNGYDDAAKGVKGEKGVDGVDGITRIVYTDKTGEHQVATMDDGMLYGGDTGTVIKKKLNNQVNVKGGITDPAKFTADDNIGVVSDGTDTLKVRLAKDLKGLNTVTATETVKAGDVVMGKQSDGTPAANTGNYVTGLDNKDWDVTNPTAVSGRAATEDQLKKVTEAINNQSANSTDYRLIKNQAAGSNGDYTVDNNGDVALTVQDKNHTDKTETVTIKDVASKSALDKLDDRAVKYNLDPATNTVDKSKVTYEGPAYTNKTGGTHVINVAYATGTDGSEAVNVDYLTDKIKDSSDALINKGLKFDANVGGVQTNKLGSTVTIKGEGTAADAKYSGENIKTFIEQDKSGNTIINVKMNKDIIADTIKVNKDGRDGKDGVSITGPSGVVGTDGNNGKVGITGADGKDAVSISGKDGVGHIGLTGPAGTNGINGTNGIDMTVKNGYDDATKGVKGEKGVDGKDGITRIVYADKTGEHQVATMDDGMLYGGDSGTVIKKKLNNQVNVKGGITDPAKFTADDNIGVVSDGTDTLKVRLAKDLKGLDTVTVAKTVTAGTATVGKQEVTKADGTKETGNYVTGLDNKTWDADNIVTGRAATEDQLKEALSSQANAGLKFDANVGGVKTNTLGSTVIIKGEGTDVDANYSGENIRTFIEQDKSGNTTINVKMNKNIIADSIKVNKDGKNGKDGVSITGPSGVAGQDGNNGKVGITSADGKDAVSISGKDGVGHIGLTGPAGTNGINGTNGIDMSVKNGYDDAAKGVKGEKGVDGVDGITRIVYADKTGEHQVATMDDGMLYGGDSGTVIKKKLNNQVNVKGGITDETKLTDEDNLGVVADGTDTLKIRLAKDLKGLNSITFNNGTNGNTVINGGGMTINDKAGNPLTSVTKDGVKITDGPSMTKEGVDAGSKKITNVADGTIGAGSKDAVNGGQLHSAVEGLKTKGFGLTAEDGNSVKKPLGDTVTVKGDGTNIKTSVDGGAVNVELVKDLNVDSVTTGNTKMDTDGVTIKDGTKEATKLTKEGLQINDDGNKAVTITKDGLTIENGPKIVKDGIDAGSKKITNVSDGTIGGGSKDAVNGGQLHTAIEDIKAKGFGLKAEDGNSVKKSLGDVIDLKGDGNIKTSVDGTAIKMSLNDTITLGSDSTKQVKLDGTTGTISAVNTVKAGDAVVGKQEVTKADGTKETGNYVTGLDNKTWNPNDPKAVSGRAATEDQLKVLNDDFNEKAKNGRVFQGDQAGNDGKVVKGLGDTVNIKGGADVTRLSDNNIAVLKNAAGDGYDIKLAKDLNLKDGSTSYTKVVPGAGPTPGYTVDTRVDGGGITITPSINGNPVPGRTVTLTENGLNNGNNTITNVAPGVNGTDAVNVNQLGNAISDIGNRISEAGAASAAMAGLKPLQYDPLEPTQVMAAIGNYKGSTAAAIGVAHYTNESTMLHMGVSLGAHDNMVNAGVSYKFGSSDAKKAIPERYKAGPISSAYVMQDEVTALKAENLRMKQRDEELSAKYEQVQRDNEEMKAQIAMLMKQVGLTK